MVTLTQAEYDKFKYIMCAYFDVDGGELPKSFEKDLFERGIMRIKDSKCTAEEYRTAKQGEPV